MELLLYENSLHARFLNSYIRKTKVRQTSKSVKKFVIKDYNAEDLDFPSALCNGCYLLLNKKAKGFDVQLPIVASYDPERSKSLRSSSSVCNCRICQVAKLKFKEAVQKGSI